MTALSPQELETVDAIISRLQRGTATAAAQDDLRAIFRRSREMHGGARHQILQVYAISRAYGGKG